METASDPNAFWVELEGARSFETRQTRRHRGLIDVWVGLMGLAVAGLYTVPALNPQTPRSTYVAILLGMAAYVVLVTGAWIHFRFSFRWKGIWKEANALQWNALWGFVASFILINVVLGTIHVFWTVYDMSQRPGASPEDAGAPGIQALALPLAVFGISWLAINVRPRNQPELVLASAQSIVAFLAYVVPGPFTGLKAVLVALLFAPSLILGIFRLWAPAGR